MAAPTKAQIAAQLDALRVEHAKALAQIEHLNGVIATFTAVPKAQPNVRPITPYQIAAQRARELAMRSGKSVLVSRGA
jgi:hypothetical protein